MLSSFVDNPASALLGVADEEDPPLEESLFVDNPTSALLGVADEESTCGYVLGSGVGCFTPPFFRAPQTSFQFIPAVAGVKLVAINTVTMEPAKIDKNFFMSTRVQKKGLYTSILLSDGFTAFMQNLDTTSTSKL
ncbi:hypothetical protein [Chamaesiphon sp. OTE_20_metabat_361]|uniref:hypothetical protein n=1 Tax=Chamaesiphon sp. OTE_20_metabat_361 TaxID=2964689 RepID=UPI00286B8018|nr:hypothetical protein [Chamaesiphon sp. OTE_20_metabat_361]